MLIEKYQLDTHNEQAFEKHKKRLNFLTSEIEGERAIIQKLMDFQIAIPSWALGTGGTRFGRFPRGGEPRNLEEKIEDVGLIHALNRSSGAISLHIPWIYREILQQLRLWQRNMVWRLMPSIPILFKTKPIKN